MAMAALLSIFGMARSFLEQGLRENLLRTQTALFLEKAKQMLTFSYSNDSYDQLYVPQIYYHGAVSATTGDRIDFWTPDNLDTGTAMSYSMFIQNGQVKLTHDGATESLLRSVTGFSVSQEQEGLISMVVTVKYSFYTLGRQVEKQFTMVGRALPRNAGKQAWKG